MPSPTQRRRLNHSGILESFSNIIRVDFDNSDESGDDDYDIFEFLRQNLINETLDTESDFSELSMSDLFDDYLYHYN